MAYKIKPSRDRIVVTINKAPEHTVSGIILPKQTIATADTVVAIVTAVNELSILSFRIGDKVVLSSFVGNKYIDNDCSVVIVDVNDVLGVLEEVPAF